MKEKFITWEEFKELNKNDEYCFEKNSTELTDDAEDYCIHKIESVDITMLNIILEQAEKIIVYKKKKFTLTGNFIFESILSYLEDNYGYDSYEFGSLEDTVGSNIFDKACEEFNKHFKDTFYTLGEEQDFYLNLRKEMKEILDENRE